VQEYQLEPARSADAPLLAAMSQQFVEAGLKPAWGAVRIGWHMRDADSVVLTARASHALAGFAIMRYADESAHLNLLAVAPAHRRQGVARALLQGRLEAAPR
jgi:ribosomal-protein-alanine N-acetyltransferase